MVMRIVGNKVKVSDDRGPVWMTQHQELATASLNENKDSVIMMMTGMDDIIIPPGNVYGKFALQGTTLNGWFYDTTNTGWIFEFLRDTSVSSGKRLFVR